MTNTTLTQPEKLKQLRQLFNAVTFREGAAEKIKELQNTAIAQATPEDVVKLVHLLVEEDLPMEELKIGISKFLNVLYKTMMAHPYERPAEGTFFDTCIKNNDESQRRLAKITPYMHRIREQGLLKGYKAKLAELWENLKLYTNYYLIKENILFPLIEKHVDDYRCIAVMWSIHDDIRRNINTLTARLLQDDIDAEELNRITGDLFFDIKAVIFREERLLFPFLEQMIPANEIESLFNESLESGFPYYVPDHRETVIDKTKNKNELPADMIDLKTGQMTAEQILMVFNHLPVDITYVDENDTVRFFSTPKHRIFHRTVSVIGRDVHNCHPKESVHIVEEIIESFRNGSEDSASFWINMRSGQRVLIQYFALRDDKNNYRGVIEVSQIINEIQALEGERRILDWGK